ncbi:MAG: hypothetical protein FJX76_06505 [Armatimonadetes bacterium]|nr:hypothetical protein [Armatimonadota bacterium]
MIALPSMATAYDVLPGPDTSVSTVLPEPEPLSGIEAAVRDREKEEQNQESSEVSASGERKQDVPWYDPIEQRARDFNDGFQGLRGKMDGYTKKINDTLNDNTLARYETGGTLGAYQWKFDPLSFKVEPHLTLRVNRWGAGARAEASLLRGSLDRKDQVGEWDRVQGVRAEVLARRELGAGAKLNLKGISPDNLDTQFAGPRMELFRQYQRAGSEWKQTYDFNVGASHDFLSDTPVTYARALQRFDNETIAQRWLGEGSKLRIELEEGVQHNFASNETRPYYRAFTGASKPVTLKAFGKSAKLDIEAGLQVQGTTDRPVEARPIVRARVHL